MKYEFKGKRNGKWVYGGIFNDCFIVKDNEFFEIDPDTLCIKSWYESDGIPVWENDIIQDGRNVGKVCYGNHRNDPKQDGFYVMWKNDSLLREDLFFWASRGKIIGNMVDNPELYNEYEGDIYE